jgi:hypothetical protein
MQAIFDDARDSVVERASESRVQYRIEEVTQPDDGTIGRSLFLDFPNGRETWPLRVSALRAQQLLESNFENWTLLGDYMAVLDTSTGSIEAAIRQAIRAPTFNMRDLRNLPGVRRRNSNAEAQQIEVDSRGQKELDDEIMEAAEYPSEEYADSDWMLEVAVSETSGRIELSPSNAAFYALDDIMRIRPVDHSALPPSLKIHGIAKNSVHVVALKILERYSTAFFFELDLRYNYAISLRRLRSTAMRWGRRVLARERSPITVIRNAYAESAVALYFYGRSARELPLLQYLAYYQAIEHFYPSFSDAEMMRRIRIQLKDPRFDPDNDRYLQKMISLAQVRGKTSTEREQLRVTLEACIEENDLLEFLTFNNAIKDHFFGKKQIRGVSPIKAQGENIKRLVDQIAERVYIVRCRIVHTKEAGGLSDVDPLLPFGWEADLLRPDIQLMQFLAQKVIISGSRGTL